eukprot:365608-Chlamydomonas_euryale.AAC.29
MSSSRSDSSYAASATISALARRCGAGCVGVKVCDQSSSYTTSTTISILATHAVHTDGSADLDAN